MLLSNRRTAVVHFCIAGMQAAWILPFWLLAYRPAESPLTSYIGLLAALLAWMLVLELLSRTPFESPGYDLLTLGLMFVTSLVAIRAAPVRGRTDSEHVLAAPRSSQTLNFTGSSRRRSPLSA